MNTDKRLAQWARLCEQDPALPALQAISLGVRAERLDSADALAAAITASGPREGWITYQSASHAFLGGDWQRNADEAGLVLSGEWVGEVGSCALTRTGSGWVLTTFEPDAGEKLLCDEFCLLARPEALGRVRYRRVWRDDAHSGVPTPWAMQFLGFDKEAECA